MCLPTPCSLAKLPVHDNPFWIASQLLLEGPTRSVALARVRPAVPSMLVLQNDATFPVSQQLRILVSSNERIEQVWECVPGTRPGMIQ